MKAKLASVIGDFIYCRTEV